jgi:hypothetical protein
MKKPSRNEVKAALVLCIFLLIGATIATVLNQRNFYYSDLAVTDLSSTSTSSMKRTLVEEYGLGGSPQTSILADERIKDIKQWVNGELKKGTFEEVVLGIEDETDTRGGYVQSEDVTFTDDIWSGEIVAKIPQNNSLSFVFKVRSLISENGKVVSIVTNIKDITPTDGTAVQKPLAQVRITLKEISDRPWQLTLPTIELQFLAGVLPVLSAFFTWVIIGIVIGIPAYFTMLGIVLLIDRALRPATNKLFKKT